MHRRLLSAAVVLACLSPLAARAAGAPERQAILDGYAAEARKADPAFAGFSAQRGEKLFRTQFAGGDARTPACTSCHTADPRQPGRNAKTGRAINPVAVSVTPAGYTDPDKLDKHFSRDCQSVLGRACTVVERGDYVTFMAGQ